MLPEKLLTCACALPALQGFRASQNEAAKSDEIVVSGRSDSLRVTSFQYPPNLGTSVLVKTLRRHGERENKEKTVQTLGPLRGF